MAVYVDIIFLTNLAVDGTVLLTTAKTRHLRPARLRVFAAATLGALYAAAMFWADIPYLYSFGSKVLVSVLMVLLAFGYGGPLLLARNMIAFYLVSFAALGGVIGLNMLLRSSGSPWGEIGYTGGAVALQWQMQLGLFAGALLLSLWLLRSGLKTGVRRQEQEQLIREIEITIDDQRCRTRALLDTGNRLYDPLTRTPVIIMEAGLWADRLPPGWGQRLAHEAPDRLLAELSDDPSGSYAWAHRLRLVPYRTVNGGPGPQLLLALKPDAVTLLGEGRPPVRITRVLVGLDGGTMSPQGAYNAIIHPDLQTA